MKSLAAKRIRNKSVKKSWIATRIDDDKPIKESKKRVSKRIRKKHFVEKKQVEATEEADKQAIAQVLGNH